MDDLPDLLQNYLKFSGHVSRLKLNGKIDLTNESIPGSYEKAGYKFTDYESIVQAAHGLSTAGKERGRGLRYCRKLIVEALNGEILIVSAKAAIYESAHQISLGSWLVFQFAEHRLNGTLIGIRIPFSSEIVDYTKYVE